MKINARRDSRATLFRGAGWLAVAAMATMALFASPGIALGHSVTPSCGHITLSNSNLPAYVYDHNTATLVAGPSMGPRMRLATPTRLRQRLRLTRTT
jgi:hypothetical protein